MNTNKTWFMLGLLVMGMCSFNLVYSALVYYQRTTASITVLPDDAPDGLDFTVPASISFPELHAGQTSEVQITIVNHVYHPLALTVEIEGDYPGFTIYLPTPIVLPAGDHVNPSTTTFIVALIVDEGVSEGTHDLPVIFTASGV